MELRNEMHKAIDLLPEHILQAFYLIAKEHINSSYGSSPVRPPFQFGSLKNKFHIYGDFDEEIDENDFSRLFPLYGCAKENVRIADDFDAPLEEMEEYM